jgi:hypothetical protein
MMDAFLVWNVSIDVPDDPAMFRYERAISKVFLRSYAQSVRGHQLQKFFWGVTS